ncbi:MAG: hypothetical protein EBV03_11885, partial [Proteobacteria bacterium]|nr:hypothetical protein [Pseudomonadota bacterium]
MTKRALRFVDLWIVFQDGTSFVQINERQVIGRDNRLKDCPRLGFLWYLVNLAGQRIAHFNKVRRFNNNIVVFRGVI